MSYRLVVDMINHMYFISMTLYVPYTDPTLPQLWIDPARREKELLTGLTSFGASSRFYLEASDVTSQNSIGCNAVMWPFRDRDIAPSRFTSTTIKD